jgi:hypothetical protein
LNSYYRYVSSDVKTRKYVVEESYIDNFTHVNRTLSVKNFLSFPYHLGLGQFYSSKFDINFSSDYRTFPIRTRFRSIHILSSRAVNHLFDVGVCS